ncbi:hypothetical protein [Rickettsia endosymbiont of Halotydeus destructor]|uniref:hypothetical protein n=1 Tax=Rickettsia endosymbiont of Halotydeus destructor TaxID=2996754 RepID=UPI003BB1CEC1
MKELQELESPEANEELKSNNQDTELYTKYEPIIKELENAYNNYTESRENITAGGIAGGLSSMGVCGGLSLGFGPLGTFITLSGILYASQVVAQTYKKDLSQTLPTEGLIMKNNIKKIEEYYTQLPKDLREKWASAKTFPKLAEYLKIKYFEDKIYNPTVDCPVLDYANLDIAVIEGEDWIKLSGDGDTKKLNYSDKVF